MHRLHRGLTVAVAIKEGKPVNNPTVKNHTEALRQLLRKWTEPRGATPLRFDCSDSTLFVSGVILPQQDYHGETLPETFVLATSYCGPLDCHLNELLLHCKDGLCQLFDHCTGFELDKCVTDDYLLAFLQAHSHPSFFTSRFNCITKADITRERLLRAEIENYLDKAKPLHAFESITAVQAKTLIERHLAAQDDDYEWAHQPPRKNIIEWLETNTTAIITNALFLVIVLYALFTLWIALNKHALLLWYICIPAGLAILSALLVFLISKDRTITAPRPPDSYVREVTATQLHPVVNEMTATAPLKRGTLRKHFYYTLLQVIPYVYKLSVPTVSTIRWLVTDNKKRLVFLSNYVNTTDAYVRDFLVGDTPLGVNLMFTNGEGFPDAQFFVGKGIRANPEGYMNAVHTGQVVTDYWYAHEATTTIDMIHKNRQIRNGLFQKMTEEEASQWLQLL